MADQIQLLQQISDHLAAIRGVLTSPKLGLGEDPSPRYIYCNRSNDCLWYEWINEAVIPVTQTALTGYIKGISLESKERRGKEVLKMRIRVEADRLYTLEAGHDTSFSKSILAAISTLTPEQMRLPITIVPQPGDDDSVLFCRVYIGSTRIKSTYDKDTDFSPITAQAIANIEAAWGTTGEVPSHSDNPQKTQSNPPQEDRVNYNRILKLTQKFSMPKEQIVSILNQLFPGKKTVDLDNFQVNLLIDEILIRWAMTIQTSNGQPIGYTQARDRYATLMDTDWPDDKKIVAWNSCVQDLIKST